MNYLFEKFEVAGVKYFFQTLAQRYPNKAFLITILKVFFTLDEPLHFEKVECADSEYDNSFSKLQLKINCFSSKSQGNFLCLKSCTLINLRMLS